MEKEEKKVTDPSYSRLHTPFIPEIKKLSLDKIRVVGDFNMRYIDEIFNIKDRNLDIKLIDADMFRGQYVSSAGSTLNFEYNDKRAQVTRSANFWVEWNPNKVLDSDLEILKPLFRNVNNAHCTRLDIAFDVDKDLSNYLVHKDKPIAHRVFYGRDNAIETRYFGSPNSNRYIKIYNKKLELYRNDRVEIEEENLWRFEITLKSKKIEDITNALTGIHLYLPSYEMLEKPTEKAMLYWLQSNQQNFNEVDDKTKTKYRKIIKETQDFSLTKILDDKLQSDKNRLLKQLNGYLDMYNTSKKITS